MSMAILILAAGTSSRMGRPKQLLLLGSKTLIQLSLETALASGCQQVYCVLGAHASVIAQNIKEYPVNTIKNPNYAEGMSSSLRAGIQFLEDRGVDSVLVLLADMPNVSTAHLQALMNLFNEQSDHPVATAYKKGLGVPAIFPKSQFKQLKALEGDKGAKALLNEAPGQISSVPFDKLTDIDTPEDYREFLRNEQDLLPGLDQ